MPALRSARLHRILSPSRTANDGLRSFFGWGNKKLSKEEKKEMAQVLKCRKDAELSAYIVEDGSVDPACQQPRVVIVGGGLAGLSAANRLLQCGIDDFVILEATDRPGGRIHTCQMGNLICDLGAEKIFGSTPTNSVFNLAAREGLMKDEGGSLPRGRGLCLTTSGPVSRLVERTAHHSLDLIEKQAVELDGNRKAFGPSLWEFVKARILQEIEIYPGKHRVMASRKMFGLTNDLRNFLGADLEDIALNQLGTKCGTMGRQTAIPTGMVGILAPLLRQIPSCDHIKYCKKVQQIIWKDEVKDEKHRAKVVCCDATTYNADYVIVTVPLGVLKEKVDTFFSPSLTDEKKAAIMKMGFGNICRVTLEYEKPFWVWGDGTMVFGWSLSELMSRKVCPDWVKGIGTVDETAGSQQCLTFSIAGQEADIAEGLSDVKIAEDFTRALRKFTRDPTLPYPVNVLKSEWRSSEYFRGARPYNRVGSLAGHICELAMPIPEESRGVPVLLFAGDATSPKAMGTMQGARQSGIREADRVIALTRKMSGRPRPDAFESLACQGRTLDQEDEKIAAKN